MFPPTQEWLPYLQIERKPGRKSTERYIKYIKIAQSTLFTTVRLVGRTSVVCGVGLPVLAMTVCHVSSRTKPNGKVICLFWCCPLLCCCPIHAFSSSCSVFKESLESPCHSDLSESSHTSAKTVRQWSYKMHAISYQFLLASIASHSSFFLALKDL